MNFAPFAMLFAGSAILGLIFLGAVVFAGSF